MDDLDSNDGDKVEKDEGGSASGSSNAINNETPLEIESELLRGNQASLLILAVSMAGFLYTLDISIIVTAIPRITTHFHTIKDIGWYGSAYLITICACTPIIGKIYQFYNAKTTFFVFISIFEIGSLVCGLAPSSTALVIGRAVAGIGGSGLFSGALIILANSLPKERRAQVVSMVYVLAMLGNIIAPIIGGVLTEKASWRWCFYINLPPGIISLFIIYFIHIPDRRDKPHEKPALSEIVNRLDPIGFILFASLCVMILLALESGGSNYAWNSSTIIGLFVGFGATLVVFVFWENRRGDTAMVPLSLLQQRVVYSSCLVVMTQFGALQCFQYYIPLWFQAVLGVNPIVSGGYFMATAGAIVFSTLVAGTLGAKLGNPTIFAILGNAVATIGGGLLSTFTPSTHAHTWAGYQVLAGLGRGMTMQQPVNAVQHILPTSKMSVGTSMVVFSQFFGSGLFLALAQTDFSNSLSSSLAKYAPGISVTLVSEVGGTGLRSAVSGSQLPGVLEAYNHAIINVFYLGTGLSGIAVFAALGMGFKRQTKDEPAQSTKV